jgi:hypothetical protein
MMQIIGRDAESRYQCSDGRRLAYGRNFDRGVEGLLRNHYHLSGDEFSPASVACYGRPETRLNTSVWSMIQELTCRSPPSRSLSLTLPNT